MNLQYLPPDVSHFAFNAVYVWSTVEKDFTHKKSLLISEGKLLERFNHFHCPQPHLLLCAYCQWCGGGGIALFLLFVC